MSLKQKLMFALGTGMLLGAPIATALVVWL